MFWIALAAQISAPVPTNLYDWATADDVPIKLIPKGPSLSVGFRVVVDPVGHPQVCEVTHGSGIIALDRYTCALVIRRARFKPATDNSGSSVFGAFSSSMAWWQGDYAMPPAPYVGDLDLVGQTLPAGARSTTTVRVTFAVDSEGHATACAANYPKSPPDPELVRLACDQVGQRLNPAAVTDAQGRRVPSVQEVEVRFLRPKT